MNKKQIVGLIVAAVVFTAVGTISMLLHVMLKDSFQSSAGWLEDSSYMDSYTDEYGLEDDYTRGYEFPEEPFVGLVEVKGDILRGYSDYYYDGYSDYYDHEWTLNYIDEMMAQEHNKGLLLYVDSAGGGAYESDELYLKLLEYKEETGRPIWSYMASEACSGGYYITMASDKIYCNRNGLTGSIGVIMTLTDYTELMEQVGIEEINITSGKNKTMGSETETMTQEQKDIFQSLVDETYEQFVEIVADGRNMTKEEVRTLGDGRVYTPKQALELNLIDEIAAFDKVKADFEVLTGVETTACAERAAYAAGQGGRNITAGADGESQEELAGLRWYDSVKRWQKAGRPMYEAR